MNIVDFFQKVGPTVWPLLVLSILSLSTIFERLWFWSNILKGERRTANRIVEASRRDWDEATHIAKQVSNQPIGRFLYTPLRLANQEPEIFRLALEASADEELTAMRKGSKVLEAVIALAPLLGLFGTVWGLIDSLDKLEIGSVNQTAATPGFGISQALYSTALGLAIAITSLAFYRIFQGLVFNQARIFRRTGNELELVYRQFWLQDQTSDTQVSLSPPTNPPHLPGY
ncbi:MAG: MotA/TolQ/ExbB proton channel family protein [Acaryochloridaceae cyanobacterium SU_2_1]|nr:MotA/TolQ/ExbB proton channel family protein [Acaryochloridaceae cyanobacterium SU_2_1]